MSPREKRNSVRINVFLAPEDHEALKEIAEEEGSNVSLVVRRAVKQYIAEQKK